MTKRILQRLASDVIAQLNAKYELVYVDYRDQLTEQQVAMLVAGERDKLLESTEEWESESRHSAVSAIIREGVDAVVARWEREDGVHYHDLHDALIGSDARERIEEAIHEREDGDWLRELVSHTPRALLRIQVLDEDHGYSHEPVAPERVLTDVGLPVTPANVANVADALANASPEFSSLLGYWIASLDLVQLYDLPDDVTHVTITNPHLFLGNPVAGTGFITQDPLDGAVVVAVADLRTDKAAFGYSVTDLYGGLDVSAYEADIAAAHC